MQAQSLKLLFICSENFHRSKACEEVFNSKPGFEAKSGGTWESAQHHLELGDLQWADLVFVMEKRHQDEIGHLFPEWIDGSEDQVEVLGIPDSYFSPEALERLKPACEAVVLERVAKRNIRQRG